MGTSFVPTGARGTPPARHSTGRAPAPPPLRLASLATSPASGGGSHRPRGQGTAARSNDHAQQHLARVPTLSVGAQACEFLFDDRAELGDRDLHRIPDKVDGHVLIV